MAFLNTLSNLLTGVTVGSNFLLVNPSDPMGFINETAVGNAVPKADSNTDAFLFHYEGENTLVLESDITDHAIEENSMVQDQISLKPETITTHGFIGELNDVAPTFFKYPRIAVEKLLVLSAYTPKVSATALRVYNNSLQVYRVAELALQAATGALNFLGLTDEDSQNKQQKTFQKFYKWWKSRTLFTVRTPWAVFENMAIKTLRAVQDPDTNMITDFEITFKKMRFAQTATLGGRIFGLGRFTSQFSSLSSGGVSPATPSRGLFSTPLLGG